jgi:hypothetical protein
MLLFPCDDRLAPPVFRLSVKWRGAAATSLCTRSSSSEGEPDTLTLSALQYGERVAELVAVPSLADAEATSSGAGVVTALVMASATTPAALASDASASPTSTSRACEQRECHAVTATGNSHNSCARSVQSGHLAEPGQLDVDGVRPQHIATWLWGLAYRPRTTIVIRYRLGALKCET